MIEPVPKARAIHGGDDAARAALEQAIGEAVAAPAVSVGEARQKDAIDEAAHQRAREKALEPSRAAIGSAEARLRELALERRKLDDEVEFYRGRMVPIALRQQVDGNEAQAEAQRTSIRNGQAEQERIHRLFDAELERLRKLWNGAMPGSLGPPPQ